MVRASWAVMPPPQGDVVYGAVYCEVDWEIRVCAVVTFKVCVCELLGSVLVFNCLVERAWGEEEGNLRART